MYVSQFNCTDDRIENKKQKKKKKKLEGESLTRAEAPRGALSVT